MATLELPVDEPRQREVHMATYAQLPDLVKLDCDQAFFADFDNTSDLSELLDARTADEGWRLSQYVFGRLDLHRVSWIEREGYVVVEGEREATRV